MLSHILKKPRTYILAHGEKRLTKNQVTSYKLQVTRRLKREPLAYITGHKEFYGLDFRVNKHVLIPRPETELMVEEALKHVTHSTKHITVVDVGTGSGCIIITLVKILNLKSKILNLKLFATDVSQPALAVARQNAKFHGVSRHIKFFRGNLLEPILKNPKHLENPKNPIVILANLPYLTPKQVKNSPTIEYEPKLALSAGPDGLKYYRRLLSQIKRLLKVNPPAGGQLSIFCEIDPSQTVGMKKLVNTILPQAELQIKKDLAGLDRVTLIAIRTS